LPRFLIVCKRIADYALIYDNYKTMNDSVYGKTKKRSIEELNKEYREKLK